MHNAKRPDPVAVALLLVIWPWLHAFNSGFSRGTTGFAILISLGSAAGLVLHVLRSRRSRFAASKGARSGKRPEAR